MLYVFVYKSSFTNKILLGNRNCYVKFHARCKSQDASSARKWNIAATSALKLPNHPFPASTVFKSVCSALRLMNCFPNCNPFLTYQTLLASRYSVFMADVQAHYISLVSPVQTFTARSRQATYTESNEGVPLR